MELDARASFALPDDAGRAILVGRVWRPDLDGPSVVAVRGVEVVDISSVAPTMRDLCEAPEPAGLAHDASGEPIGSLDDILANTPRQRRDPESRGCWHRSTCRRSRPPASPSPFRWSSA